MVAGEPARWASIRRTSDRDAGNMIDIERKDTSMRTLIGITLVLCAATALAQEPAYKGLGAESVTPEVIAKYAPRPLDPRFTRDIEKLLDVRAPGLGIPSPDGKKLYFGWQITGTPQVFRLDQPKGFPIQMTGGDERTTLHALTPDGKWL